MTSLYKLADDYVSLINNEELPDEAIIDTLEAIDGEIEQKAEAIMMVINELSSNIDAIDNEIKRLQARKKARENAIKSVRMYFVANMLKVGKDKIKTALFNISLVKPRQNVVIDDENQIDEKYLTVKTSLSVDKKSILAAINSGEEVSGARVELGDYSLRVS